MTEIKEKIKKKAEETLPPYIIGKTNIKNLFVPNLPTGRGLFAARNIKKGEVIFNLKENKNGVCVLSRQRHEKLLQENPTWVMDSCFHFCQWVLIDLNIKDGKYIPFGS